MFAGVILFNALVAGLIILAIGSIAASRRDLRSTVHLNRWLEQVSAAALIHRRPARQPRLTIARRWRGSKPVQQAKIAMAASQFTSRN
jgi:hypothetical protein